MPKRKARQDPDSSDEDVGHYGQAELQKRPQPKKKTTKDRASEKATTGGPFEYHARPSEAEARAARDSLAQLHGEPTRPDFVSDSTAKAKKSILDSLVQTILSQNTTDTNSHRTFANLKAAFPEWEEVRSAPSAKVEAAIKLGGLAAIKTERIKSILDSTVAESGECTLEHLRSRSDEEIKEELLKFKGVGPKTAACVLMFAMGRFEFPVDTHVWRITKSLGWVPGKANREETYEHLNTRIPDDIKYDLHVLLVEHGKRCVRCASNGHPRKEQHGPCPLVNLAAAAKAGQKLSGNKAAEDAKQSLNLSEDDMKAEPIKEEQGVEQPVKKEETGSKEEQLPSDAVKKEIEADQWDSKDNVQVKAEGIVEAKNGESMDSAAKVKEDHPASHKASAKTRSRRHTRQSGQQS